MKEFLDYFFSKGDTIEFNNFSLAHFLPIIVALGIIFLIYFFRNRIRDCKFEKKFRYVMAFSLIVSEMS